MPSDTKKIKLYMISHLKVDNIIKRFYPSKGPFGHASKIFNLANKKPNTHYLTPTPTPNPSGHGQNNQPKPNIKEVDPTTFKDPQSIDKNPNTLGQTLWKAIPSVLTPKEITELLEKAKGVTLVGHENTSEGGPSPNTGGLVLTPDGYRIHKSICRDVEQEHLDTVKPTACFEIGLLDINNETEILLPVHTHLVVLLNTITNKRLAIGILTSQQTPPNIKLSDKQELSGNLDKPQFFKAFSKPLLIEENQFNLNTTATTLIQQKQISNLLMDIALDQLKKPFVLYDSTGITWDHLKLMVEKVHQLNAEKSLVSAEKTFLSQDKLEKALKKKEKAELNKKKQQEELKNKSIAKKKPDESTD